MQVFIMKLFEATVINFIQMKLTTYVFFPVHDMLLYNVDPYHNWKWWSIYHLWARHMILWFHSPFWCLILSSCRTHLSPLDLILEILDIKCSPYCWYIFLDDPKKCYKLLFRQYSTLYFLISKVYTVWQWLLIIWLLNFPRQGAFL